MAIKINESYLYPDKYQSSGLKEFIFRGSVREEKGNNVRATEKRAFNSRERLKQSIQVILKNYFKSLDKPIPKQHRSFYEWIQRKDRTLMLETKENLARRTDIEAKSMKYAIETICKLHDEYQANASIFLKTAEDAVNHDDLCKCVWTWWR